MRSKKMDRIKVRLDEYGIGKVWIDKKDISNKVTSVSLIAKAGESPEVIIKMLAEDINFKIGKSSR